MTRIGGSFAPPITQAVLNSYAALAETAPPQIEEALDNLIRMVVEYQKQPPPVKKDGKPHPSGVGLIVPLEAKTMEAIEPHVPWNEELDMYAGLFEKLDPISQKALRNAAFHLLWYGRELFLDREPLTSDKL